MKYFILLLAVLMSFPGQAGEADRNKIQIALLLDTSNSMDGLIEQAKGKLWTIVNEFARYKKGEQAPQLEISLFEYGNDGLPAHTDWIRQITPFTTDLDFISEKLFELTTYGGSEYCGTVIHDANQKLEWSHRSDDLKLIFIAGNEGFDQGRFSYREACLESVGKGIAINTIYCGSYEQGIREFWKEGASLGKGKYINIDHNEQVSYIETPYDKDLERLNRSLNDTYIGYGAHGAARKTNQMKQDDNARSFSGANAAERVVSKASAVYSNAEWDLVDAYEDNGGNIEAMELEEATLPAHLKGKSEAEIEAYIRDLSKKRESIQKEIKEISAQRAAYIAKQSSGSQNTLDQAIITAVESLAKAKGYQAGK